MSIRLTLIVGAAIATLVGSPAFAWHSDGNRLPSYYTYDGARHMGRPHNEHAITPTQQNDWWWGGSHH